MSSIKKLVPSRIKSVFVRLHELSKLNELKYQQQEIKYTTERIESGLLRMIPQPRLSYFVLNILDHCNLRCKGCDHFACIAEERYVALEDIERDLKRMSEITGGAVTRIGVMGGEPLLHPDLKQILALVRSNFRSTVVQLVTNGLLLLKQDDEFWRVCREYGVMIGNTKYPLPLDYEGMLTRAKAEHVDFEFYGTSREGTKTQFKVPLDIRGLQNPQKSHWNCFHANAMPLLMEGKLYRCTVAPNVRHFNKKFGTNMELEDGDWLEIYRPTTAKELLSFLCSPGSFCRYCRTSERSYGHQWERSKQEMSEWT